MSSISFYKLRVDLSDLVPFRRVLSNLGDCPSYAYVIEGGTEHPHCHWYLESFLGAAGLRSRLRSMGLRGNGSYSLTRSREQHPIEYLAYLMKEGTPVFVGIPDSVLEKVRTFQADFKKKSLLSRCLFSMSAIKLSSVMALIISLATLLRRVKKNLFG